MSDQLSANLVHFVRYLRSRGLTLGPTTAATLARVADTLGLDDRTDLYHGMKSVVVTRPTHRPIFDEAFDLFFGTGRFGRGEAGIALDRDPPEHARLLGRVPVLAPDRPLGTDDDVKEMTDTVGGAYAETLANRDFDDLTPEEREEVFRIMQRMVWKPADTPSRRWRPSRSGVRPDLRRTLRGIAGPSGDMMPFALSERKQRTRPLVVLADVSGSMERYTEMFLHFIHAAQGRMGRVEAFVFATRLSRITRQLRTREPSAALRQVADAVQDWSGGTRIGEVLGTFNREWSRRVTSGGAIGLIISDGWDTGDPEVLDIEMARFARSMHRVIWLNPLAGRTGFAPETRGMITVLPHVDDFLAAGTLSDLRAVVTLLESVPARRGAMV